MLLLDVRTSESLDVFKRRLNPLLSFSLYLISDEC